MKFRRLMLSILGLVVLAGSAWACNVPVFRYALERWPADEFRAVVVHQGPLTPSDEALVVQLKETLDPRNALRPNLTVEFLDPLAETNHPLAACLRDENLANGARLAVFFPAKDDPTAPFLCKNGCPATPGASSCKQAWSGPLAEIGVVLDSPARRELGRRLLAGDSVVWLLVESGDKARDEAAAALLKEELPHQAALASTASEVELDPEATNDPAVTASTAEPVKVAFSMMRLSRADPAERAFLGMLLATEPGLAAITDHPLVFPVFGRGRVLYALAGRGIRAELVAEACDYLTGPCSCEVKDQNPGTDLLIAADWDHPADGQLVTDDPLPPLTGVWTDAVPARVESSGPQEKAKPPVAPAGGRIFKSSAFILGLIAGGVLLLVVRVMRSRGG